MSFRITGAFLTRFARNPAARDTAFTRAVADEDKLGYNVPPDRLLPERVRLGFAFLAAGRAAEADLVFRAARIKRVVNPRAGRGVWRSPEAKKKDASEVGAAIRCRVV